MGHSINDIMHAAGGNAQNSMTSSMDSPFCLNMCMASFFGVDVDAKRVFCNLLANLPEDYPVYICVSTAELYD